MATSQLDLVAVGMALGCATRVEMLSALTHSSMTVGELASAVGIHQTTASYHCLRLADAGLVRVRAEGTRRIVVLRSEDLRIGLRPRMEESNPSQVQR
jgi:DNA-binding transcriptional ArsR family regulator